jgi:hypothetical protein
VRSQSRWTRVGDGDINASAFFDQGANQDLGREVVGLDHCPKDTAKQSMLDFRRRRPGAHQVAQAISPHGRLAGHDPPVVGANICPVRPATSNLLDDVVQEQIDTGSFQRGRPLRRRRVKPDRCVALRDG